MFAPDARHHRRSQAKNPLIGLSELGQPPLTVLAGVFNDNPPGGSFADDSQVRGSEQAGTRFNLQTGALLFGEVQYAALGELDHGDTRRGLPGVYKLGGWYDTGKFPDQRIDTTGLSLADPNSSGIPRSRKSNYSVYGVFDQMIWRPDPDEAQAIGIFARLMGSPGDRNLVSFSVNGGIELKAPFKDRDDDTVGLGFGVAKVSPSAIKYDQDVNSFGTPNPVRSSETFVELTYQYAVAPWWQVQPDFQYVWTPGGGIANPLVPAKRIGNEAIFGVRTSIVF
jgi:porin